MSKIAATDHNYMAIAMGTAQRGLSAAERNANAQQAEANFEASMERIQAKNQKSFPVGARVRSIGGSGATGEVIGHVGRFGDPQVRLDGSGKVIVTTSIEVTAIPTPSEADEPCDRCGGEPSACGCEVCDRCGDLIDATQVDEQGHCETCAAALATVA